MFRALPLVPTANSNRAMHLYRSHTCGELRKEDVGKSVRLSGWVHRVRDHGGLLFIDLRDHYGLTQAVADPHSPAFKEAERLKPEWVVRIDGEVVARTPETVNPNLPTGGVEVRIKTIEVLSEAKELPLPVFGEPDYPEDTRLRYRFLDLRRETPACQHHEAAGHHLVVAPAHARGRVLRVPDADPDRLDRPKARATISCRPESIPASSTRCRRRRSNSSS